MLVYLSIWLHTVQPIPVIFQGYIWQSITVAHVSPLPNLISFSNGNFHHSWSSPGSTLQASRTFHDTVPSFLCNLVNTLYGHAVYTCARPAAAAAAAGQQLHFLPFLDHSQFWLSYNFSLPTICQWDVLLSDLTASLHSVILCWPIKFAPYLSLSTWCSPWLYKCVTETVTLLHTTQYCSMLDWCACVTLALLDIIFSEAIYYCWWKVF